MVLDDFRQISFTSSNNQDLERVPKRNFARHVYQLVYEKFRLTIDAIVNKLLLGGVIH